MITNKFENNSPSNQLQKLVGLSSALMLCLIACTLLPMTAQAGTWHKASAKGKATECYMAAKQVEIDQKASASAIKSCSKAVSRSPNRFFLVKNLINRAILHRANENYVEALSDLKRAARLRHRDPSLYVAIGNMLYMNSDFEKAIDYYDKALKRAKRSRSIAGAQHIALVNRGLANQHLGELEQAVSDYRSALAIKPNYSRAQRILANVLKAQQPQYLASL